MFFKTKFLSKNFYISIIELFYSNFFVISEYFVDDFKHVKNFIVRNITSFINHVKNVHRHYDLNIYYIIHDCLKKVIVQ